MLHGLEQGQSPARAESKHQGEVAKQRQLGSGKMAGSRGGGVGGQQLRL